MTEHTYRTDEPDHVFQARLTRWELREEADVAADVAEAEAARGR